MQRIVFLAINILMLLSNFLIKTGNLFIIIAVEINNSASILKNIHKSCICVLIVDINRG